MPITTGSFAPHSAAVFPPALAAALFDGLLDGAPFAKSLNRFPTGGAGAAVWPLLDPTGLAWTPEYADLPTLNPGDSAYQVATAKLGGLLDISNEAAHNNPGGVYEQIRDALAEAFGPVLDDGLMYGQGAPQPVGAVAAFPLIDSEPDLRGAAILAASQLAAKGSTADLALYAGTDVLAAEYGRTNSGGDPLYPDGWGSPVGGLPVIPCGMDTDTAMVLNRKRVHLVERDPFNAAMSEHHAWAKDALSIRVKGHYAVGVPTPQRAGRRISLPAA